MKQKTIFQIDTCVICGDPVPEGWQVCPSCRGESDNLPYQPPMRPGIKPPTALGRFRYWISGFQKGK